MYTAEPHKSYRVEGKQFFFSPGLPYETTPQLP